MLDEGNLRLKYWHETVKAVNYMGNYLFANTREIKILYELFFKRKADVSKFTIYGSDFYVRMIPNVLRKNKFNVKERKGKIVEYEDVE